MADRRRLLRLRLTTSCRRSRNRQVAQHPDGRAVSSVDDSGDGSSSVAASACRQEAIGVKSSSSSIGTPMTTSSTPARDHQSSDEGSAHRRPTIQGPATAEPQVAVVPSVHGFGRGAAGGRPRRRRQAGWLGREDRRRGARGGTGMRRLTPCSMPFPTETAVRTLPPWQARQPTPCRLGTWHRTGVPAGNSDMLMKVGAAMLHHDAVQPVANG